LSMSKPPPRQAEVLAAKRMIERSMKRAGAWLAWFA
jgi:hypothetical protein